jgi:hypothetical protein
MDAQDSVLVVFVKTREDWDVACNRHWYRMPLKRGPSDITAGWIAFYLPAPFGDDRFSVPFYARILEVHVVRRTDLFPDQADHPHAQDPYYTISFEPPIRLAKPLRSDRARRFVWTATTFWRLTAAQGLDDLFSDEPLPPPEHTQMLVGMMPRVADLSVARDRGWYRIPQNMVREWTSPSHVAFYFGSAFGSEAGQIRYYAEAWHADIVKRIEMFPSQPRHPRAQENYLRVHLGEVLKRHTPILSRRRRRLVLLPTTWERFVVATDLNELVGGDADEDAFYGSMDAEGLRPERAYHVRGANAYQLTDYALFCRNGNIGIDVEGSTVSRNAFLQRRPNEDAPPIRSWESIRLSRFDIARRRDDTIRELRTEVERSGGVVGE